MNFFSYLNMIEPENLFNALQTEQLQTIAIVLVHIDKDLAADILNMFPADTRANIAIKMTAIDNLPEAVIKNIADILKNKIVPSAVKLGGVKAVAEILKRMKD
jgi:flagellar motor switch protein FliG